MRDLCSINAVSRIKVHVCVSEEKLGFKKKCELRSEIRQKNLEIHSFVQPRKVLFQFH